MKKAEANFRLIVGFGYRVTGRIVNLCSDWFELQSDSSSSEKISFHVYFYFFVCLFTSKTLDKYLHDKTCPGFLLHLISPKPTTVSETCFPFNGGKKNNI